MLSFFSFLQISHLHTCFTTLLVTTLKVLSSSCQVLSLQSLKHQWMCLPHFCTTSLSIVLLSLAESCFPAPEGSCCTIQRSHHTTSVHSSDGCNLCKSSGLSLCQVVRTVPATAEAFSAPCYRTGCRFLLLMFPPISQVLSFCPCTSFCRTLCRSSIFSRHRH
jgi:hypothetical protein